MYSVILKKFPKRIVPMKHFTHEESSPSETTLNIIRQIAYRYRVLPGEDKPAPCCMN